ncbi:response regulator [Brevundimonas viscosa]|uniref:Response regulator receiver domain-containing protein n=1 Tax=Brevundimonas viscosa TaxID=871741 RepID=A0A1I6SIJ1_9CAUL|nr:response regulator [Brevundimonas viscosa]SFS76568.1 Response regulator receiver domain-containing protein [Brevundimonas viscosa]
MFAVDHRLLARLEPVTKRVLIVDPNTHAARLLTDLMKALGAREIAVEAADTRAMKAAAALEPGIVFTERSGPGLDGEALARRLRRSDLPCRRAPIIMISAEATASTILGARDAGVHEFLRKPFTSADLQRRVENVALKPRDWVEAVEYVGPDRRRFNSGEYSGPGKRRSDRAATGAAALAAAKDQAMRILASALDQFDRDPMQAVRAIREQASALKAVAMKGADSRLAVAVGALEVSLASGPATKATLSAPIGGLLAMHQAEPMKKAG